MHTTSSIISSMIAYNYHQLHSCRLPRLCSPLQRVCYMTLAVPDNVIVRELTEADRRPIPLPTSVSNPKYRLVTVQDYPSLVNLWFVKVQ